MKMIGYVCCWLLAVMYLTEIIDAQGLQNKLDREMMDALSTNEPLKIKRPFCNAFTGCGKKRSFYEGSTNSWESRVKDDGRLPVSFYRTLLRAASQEIRDREINDFRLPEIVQDFDVYPSRKLTLRERHQS